MRLHYRTYGKGFPVIALHGLYASADSWMGLVSELSDSYRLILVDQRNHGRSPHSPDFSYPLLSNDLLELMDELAIEQTFLIGHSMGGKTAMHFCLHHPERVRGMVVEDMSPLAYTGSREGVAYHRQVIAAMQNLRLNELQSREDAVSALYQSIPNVGMCQFLLKNLQRNAQGNFEWRLGLEGLSNNFRNIMDGVDEGVNPVSTPTLFIKGADSSYILQQDEEAIRKLFPQSEVVSVANADHWVHIRQPEAFAKFVKQHFSSLNYL